MNLFAVAEPAQERRFSGVVQFVVLMTLYPALLSHGLFNLDLEVPAPQIFELRIYYPDSNEWRFDLNLDLFSDLPNIIHFAFLMLFFPVGLVVGLRRRAWGWVLLGLAIPWTMLAIVGLRLLLASSVFRFDPLSLVALEVATKVAFLWLVLHGRVLSRSFLVFLLLTVALTLPLAAQGVGILQVLRPLVPIVGLVLAIVLVRLVIMAVLQNIGLFRQLGLRRSLGLALRSLLLWLPIVAFAAPYLIGTAMMEEAIEERAYGPCPSARGRPMPPCAAGEEPKGWHLTIYGPERELRTDTLYSISRFFQKEADEWTASATGFESSVRGYPVADLSVRFGEQFDEVIDKRIDFDSRPSDSSWPWNEVEDIAVDKSQGAVNYGFGKVRERARARLIEKVDSLEPTIGEGQTLVGDGARKVRDTVDGVLRELNRDTQLAVWWTFVYVGAAHSIGHLLFALLCIKSFMYVFSRVAFSKDRGAHLSLADGDEVEASGPIRSVGHQYDVGDAEGGTWFFSRRFQPQGKPPRFSIPQPKGAPIARLLHGAMTMNRLVVRPGDGGMHFTATRGAEFGEWRLVDGQQVVFNIENFVGMSEGVRISTLISARLSSLVLGRFIFSVATGPGVLVLLTDGRSRFGRAEALRASLPPRQLVAFDKAVRFHVDSELGMADIYLSTAYVSPISHGQIVVDVDKQDTFATGMSRFIRHFLWPG